MSRLAVILFSLGLIGASVAQQPVDELRPASAKGVVVVDVVAGSVRVRGWERGEVRITGTLGRGTERLDCRRAGDRTTVQVIVPGDEGEVEGSDLELRVPSGSRVEVETVSADVSLDAVVGAVDVETVSGRIAVAGAPAAIDASSVSGDIEIRAASPGIHAETVSGVIEIEGATGEVTAETVSGDLTVAGAALSWVRISTTSGRARFEGGLTAEGSCEAESVSGPLELSFPADVDAAFLVKTFSGSILSDFAGKVVRTAEFTPARELRFRAGEGRARVSAQTFSGTIRLQRR